MLQNLACAWEPVPQHRQELWRGAPHQLADGGQRVEFDGVTTRPHSRFLRQCQKRRINRLGVNRVAICVCAFRCASMGNCLGPSATWM